MREPPGSLGVRGTCLVLCVLLALLGGLVPPNLACPHYLTPFGDGVVLGLFLVGALLLPTGYLLRRTPLCIAALVAMSLSAALNWAGVLYPARPESNVLFDSSHMYDIVQQAQRAAQRQKRLAEWAAHRPPVYHILSPHFIIALAPPSGAHLIDVDAGTTQEIVTPHLRPTSAVVLDPTAGALYFVGDVEDLGWYRSAYPTGIYRYDLASGSTQRIIELEGINAFPNLDGLLVKRDGTLFYHWGMEGRLYEHPVDATPHKLPGFLWKCGLLDCGDELVWGTTPGAANAVDVIDNIDSLIITVYSINSGSLETSEFHLRALALGETASAVLLARRERTVQVIVGVCREEAEWDYWLVEADLAQKTLRLIRRLPSACFAYADDRIGIEEGLDRSIWYHEWTTGQKKELVALAQALSVDEDGILVVDDDGRLRRFDLRTGDEVGGR